MKAWIMILWFTEIKITLVKELTVECQSLNLNNFVGTVEFSGEGIKNFRYEGCKYYLN
jgi:hypothetical protein